MKVFRLAPLPFLLSHTFTHTHTLTHCSDLDVILKL